MKKYWELIRNYSPVFLIKVFFKEIKRNFWQELIMNSYAQNYEDLEIEKLFLNKKRGRYLEIGAYHPTRLSNTYRLYKKGWTGIVVEPNPEVKKLFKIVRPKDKLLNIGISDKNGTLNYYQFLIPALNTFSKTEALNCNHKIVAIDKVKTKKVVDIVDEDFDFVSIDTEGFDHLILKVWPWKKYKPRVICVETDKISVDKILIKQGYKVVFKNKFNSIYSGKEYNKYI